MVLLPKGIPQGTGHPPKKITIQKSMKLVRPVARFIIIVGGGVYIEAGK